MTPEETLGIARAVADTLRPLTARLDAFTAEVQTLRAAALEPVAALIVDADGTLHLVQRGGAHLEARLPDVPALVARATTAAQGDLRTALVGELHAGLERAMEALCNAPAWDPATVYTEGQVVQAHIGRTYRVRSGVAAALGVDPGDDATRWERVGRAGFRVFKSKPEHLEAGDIFTEGDSRFLFDGAQTVLFVPKAAKVSDIERAVKAPHGLAQAASAAVRDLAETVARHASTADQAGERSLQALALTEELRGLIEQVVRRLDVLDGGHAA